MRLASPTIPGLDGLLAASVWDLILVSASWDLFRLAFLVPRASSPLAALLLVLIKIVLVEIVPYLFLRRSKPHLAAWFLAASAMVLSGVYIVLSGGLHSSAIPLEIGMVCIAVVLLGARGAAIIAGSCTTFLVALALADVRGWLPQPTFADSDLNVFSNLLTAITLATIPAARAVARLRNLSFHHGIALSRLDEEHQRLKQAEEQLHTERAHLRTILDSEPECIKLVSREGLLLDMNPAGLAMIEADSLDQVAGCKVSGLIDPEFREAFEALHVSACAGTGGRMRYSITGRRGTHRTLETCVAPLRNPDNAITATIAVTRDITAQERAETAQRESEERFRVLFEHAPFGAIILEPANFRIIDANLLAQSQFGYTREEFRKLNLVDLDANHSEAEIRDLGRLATEDNPTQFETRHRSKAGVISDVFVSALPLRINGRTVIYSVFQDITERKRLENELLHLTVSLRELAAHLEQAREEERKHIAREIHDQLGQQLTGLKVQLNNFFRASSQPYLQFEQREIQLQIEAAIRSVRSIATELRPGVLDSLGLVPALEWLARDFEAKHHIPCTTRMQEFDCDETNSTVLFRIAQEALTNIARHSRATQATVVLARSESSISLEIIDNGVGITEPDLNKSGHFGLVGIRERTLLAGGVLTVNGTLPSGTRLFVTLPITPSSSLVTSHAPALG